MTSKKGRPKKNAGPAFPHDEADKLLVHGEEVESPSGAGMIVRYPSYREVAERFGVANSLIAKYSKAHNCMRRRKQAQKRISEMVDTKLAELRADKLAVSKDDAVRIIDRFLVEFEQALKEGRVRCDNPSDYNTMIRLKSFLEGDADSRHEVLGGLTLEDIQRQHKQMREDWAASTPKMRGKTSLRVVSETPEDDDTPGNDDQPC